MYRQRKGTAPGASFAGRPRSHADSTAFHDAALRKAYPTGGGKSRGGIPLFTDDGRRRGICAGYLHADGTFSKQMKSSHVLTKPEAIAIQADVLLLLQCQGCHTVEVTLTESGKTLRASLRAFSTHGIRLNRGYGLQVALPLSQWKDAADPQESLSLFEGEE